jgi:hypothetical protein
MAIVRVQVDMLLNIPLPEDPDLETETVLEAAANQVTATWIKPLDFKVVAPWEKLSIEEARAVRKAWANGEEG